MSWREVKSSKMSLAKKNELNMLYILSPGKQSKDIHLINRVRRNISG